MYFRVLRVFRVKPSVIVASPSGTSDQGAFIAESPPFMGSVVHFKTRHTDFWRTPRILIENSQQSLRLRSHHVEQASRKIDSDADAPEPA